jgi:hypothetical protein
MGLALRAPSITASRLNKLESASRDRVNAVEALRRETSLP